MPERHPITREFLLSILAYDPETGVFTWKPRLLRPGFERTDKAWNSRRSGTEAGTVNFSGYVTVNLLGIPRYAHRLAFICMTGIAPEFVDHINRVRSDNRWANLREATSVGNLANAKLRSDNTSGLRGVCWYSATGQWHAQIHQDGERIHLGYFDRKADALNAYEIAAAKLFAEFHQPQSV